ncbi:MAG TPA: class F sortase [Candidatus Dormibacteraeota bacterium]|nr:class F sortase [Candidatus Dormibacteraeota bacterium]
MAERVTIGLDNPAFYGRLRQSDPRQLFASDKTRSRVPARPLVRQTRRINDVRDKPVAQQIQTQPPQPPTIPPQVKPAQAPNVPQPRPQTYTEPAETRLRPSTVLKRPSVPIPRRESTSRVNRRTSRHSKLQVALASMAAVIFLVGIAATIQTIKTNHQAAAQVAALAKKANNPASSGGNVVPSTAKPSPAAVRNYAVAPNLPRYIKIPKLGVNARVLQVGVLASGALGTPPNVFDTAWYTGSAAPGQPGATLIDGHVSSWSTNGVFYGLKTLSQGDGIQIVRGDGAVFNYQVVKTVTYIGNSVNMQAAMTPVTPGVSGLNLISCTGDVIPGTSTFSARIVVFAQQVSSSLSH